MSVVDLVFLDAGIFIGALLSGDPLCSKIISPSSTVLIK
jgi:hypothetical protein